MMEEYTFVGKDVPVDAWAKVTGEAGDGDVTFLNMLWGLMLVEPHPMPKSCIDTGSERLRSEGSHHRQDTPFPAFP
jgi:hypothetical protein